MSLPPPAIVALMSESSSSSPLMASCKWRGVIRFTLRSLDAFPANSRTWNHRNPSRFRKTSSPQVSLCYISVCINGGWAVTSAVRYSRIAALYTAAVAPTLPWLVVLDLRCLWIRPTGNCGDYRDTERDSRLQVRRRKGGKQKRVHRPVGERRSATSWVT